MAKTGVACLQPTEASEMSRQGETQHDYIPATPENMNLPTIDQATVGSIVGSIVGR